MTALVRYFIFVRSFDGDTDAGLEYLESKRAPWADDDREFLVWLKTQIRNDPTAHGRMIEAVDDFERALNTVPSGESIHDLGGVDVSGWAPRHRRGSESLPFPEHQC